MAYLVQPELILIVWAILALHLYINSRRIGALKNMDPVTGNAPAATVIVAVRNEGGNIGEGLHSICRQEYPDYRVVVVNDRSTDDTGNQLKALLRPYPHVTLLTISGLPAGWMGKHHAMYRAWEHAPSDYLLFTDVDVSLAPDALARAIGYCERSGTDHLAVLPQVRSRSAALNRVLDTFRIFLHLRYRPWSASRPRSSAYFGIGAFNLCRDTAYRKAGTHRKIALHPNDDLVLGEIIKASGCRQDVLYGDGMVRYEWYRSVAAFAAGLMKNTFSAFGYRLTRMLPAVLGALVLFVLPVPVLLCGPADWQIAGLLLWAMQGALVAGLPGRSGPVYGGLMMAPDALIIVYIMIASAVRTLRQGGIWWREHFYGLPDLRAALKGMRTGAA